MTAERSIQPEPPAGADPQNTDRWTKEGTTEGEDPREIDAERADAARAAYLDRHRAVTHAEQETGEELGTTSTTSDPTARG